MKSDVQRMLIESASVKGALANTHAETITSIADTISGLLRRGNKVLLAGNGGSATQASHIAAEFVGRYKLERRGLPSIALTSDMANITAIGNDYGFENIFSRQVEALGTAGDVLIGLSTSGNSENILRALTKAREMGITTVSLMGKDGGKQKGLADMEVIVPSNDTARIQESHITILHIVCELVENQLFSRIEVPPISSQ